MQVGAPIAIILAVGLVWFESAREARAEHFFSDALKSQHISERVSINGKEYAVVGGSIAQDAGPILGGAALPALRLAYEKTIARRSPILALPGTDPILLRRAVSSLKQLQGKLASIQSSEREKSLVEEGLYPISFLSAATDLEEARMQFLRTGSEEDASAYENAGRVALRAYQKDLTQFRTAFEKAVSPNAKRYATERKIITRNGVLSALDLFASTLARFNVVFSKRSACFRGTISDCTTADIQLPPISIPPEQVVSAVERSSATEVKGILERAGHLFIQKEPVTQLSSSACIETLPGTALLFAANVPSSVEYLSYTRLEYIGDMRLVRSDTATSTTFIQYFKERGVEYVPDTPLTYYGCQEVALDLGKLSAVRAVRAFTLATPLSAYVPHESSQTLMRLEKALITDSIVSEREAVEYLSLARSLTTPESLPEHVRNEIVSLSLRMHTVSDGVYQTILNVLSFENMNLQLHANGPRAELAAPYLFFVRSAFTALFMKDALLQNEKHTEIFQPTTIAPAEQPYVFYSTLPHTNAFSDTLVRDLGLYVHTHAEP
jgi:hypothetical protein